MNENRHKTKKGRLAALCLGFFFALSFPAGEARAAAVGTVGERTLVPVGQAVGVKLFADGILLVSFPEGESPAQKSGLKTGDIILACDGMQIDSTEHFQQLIAAAGETPVTLRLRRGGRLLSLRITPQQGEDGVCRLGALVRDSMAGIGTMTFYDPQSGVFGALGHGVTDVDTGRLMPLEKGSTMDASVKAVKRGEPGEPGELRGDFDLTSDSGTLYANTDCGIFGVAAAGEFEPPAAAALPLADKAEIKAGRATILSNVSGTEIKEYDIEIEKVFASGASTRNMLLRVTDEALLAATGGIVQGMSGSPIVQNGKLVGAVTHVLINDVTRGYGIFIENMLDAAGLDTANERSA